MPTPTYINTTQFADILVTLKQMNVNAAHFTNGTYAFDTKLVVPTTLAGFKRATQSYPRLPLVIAVNSDKSMEAMGKTGFEDQHTRASKVAEPLQQLFPNNKVIVLYYDEETPLELYQALEKHNLTRTLHKWGYGTSKDAPMIKGAECFEQVYGFPLPNDKKPLCYHDTEKAKIPQDILIDDLRGKLITAENRLLFHLPDELKAYQDNSVNQSYCNIL